MRFGGGNYALKNLKELKVTPSFLDLAEGTKNCGGRQTKVDCITELSMKKIVRTCKCVPLNIKDFNQPRNNVNILIYQFDKSFLS